MNKFQVLPLAKHLMVQVEGALGWCTISVRRTTNRGSVKVYAEWRCFSRGDADRVLTHLSVWAPRFEADKASMKELYRKVAPELRA
jgi:hypothetical protein